MDIQEISRVKRNKERKKKSQTSFLEQHPQNSKYPALWIIQWNICCSWARPFLGTVSFFFYLQFRLYRMQGPRCCLWAFSNRSDPGLLSSCRIRASHCSGFFCGDWAPGKQASVVGKHELSCSVASSRTRDQTCVPCIGRRVLTHCATREVI